MSLSEEGTKTGWENMLFPWVKIYYQGNDFFAMSKKGRVRALERWSPPSALGQFLPVSPGAHVSLRPGGLLTEEQRQSAAVVGTASRSPPFAGHTAGEEKTQEEEGIAGYAKGGRMWLWRSGACAPASAFGRLQLQDRRWTRRCQSAEVETEAA